MVNPETSFRSEHHTNTYLLKSRTQAISPIPDLERRQKCAAKLRSLCACQKIVELINAHADIPECSICTSVIIEPVKISAPLCSEHFLLKDIVHLWKLVDELVMNGRNTSCVYHLNICTLKKGVVHASMCEHCSSGHQSCQSSSNAPVISSEVLLLQEGPLWLWRHWPLTLNAKNKCSDELPSL